jgi:tryptophan halogenase
MPSKKPTAVNSFRGAITSTRIALEFGVAEDPAASEGDTVVALSDRIELTPAAARHLAVSLEDALRRAPAVRGNKIAAADMADERVTERGRTPVNAPRDPAAETAGLLMQQVSSLDIPYQYERSFRLARESLSANRFLLTMNRADLGDDALERCLNIARSLDMPVSLQQQVAEPFAQASCVHFGFENGTDGVVCKLYLERSVSDDERTAAVARDEAVLLHLAFKWSRGGKMRAVTRYFWYPQSPIETIRDRIAAIFESGDESEAAAFALHALELAASRADANQLQYLEVLEDDNGRRSFDLNVYEANLQVKDLQPGLNTMRDYFHVPRGHFQAIYDQVRLHSLGHIAGGVHRNGEEFFNIYHGVTSFPQFNAELG